MKRFFAMTLVFSFILLLLPCYASASTGEPRVSMQSLSSDQPSEQSDQFSELYQVYTIQHGDTLSSIGRRFGVSWRDIAKLNGIPGPKYTIITGNTLKIPTRPKLPGTTGNYLILCETEAQKQCLSDFVAFRTWSGFTVTVKSVEADVKPTANADASEAIRQYLKKTDRKMSLEYVLLIGKPYNDQLTCPQHTGGIIPMRYMYFNPSNHNTRDNCDWYDYKDSSNNGYNTPTDIYYAFDFNWDFDKDGFAGEIDEIAQSVKQADPEPLFLLGRVPFSNAKDIQTVLNSTVQFELNQKSHSDALIGSYGAWAYYADTLAKNLTHQKIETTTIFGDDENEPCKYKSTYPLSADNFSNEASKKYDFVYIMESADRYHFNPSSGDGVIAGIYFMDSFATLKIEPGGSNTRMIAQDVLANGAVSAVIATTREVGFNPEDPDPRLPSLLFSNKSLGISREFYAAIQSMIMDNNVPEAYVYCYLGDPSITLNP